jgi:hypothetical protein
MKIFHNVDFLISDSLKKISLQNPKSKSLELGSSKTIYSAVNENNTSIQVIKHLQKI